MSYSNDWSISGITGLTSLKDCYQWNGVKRLYNFGMLRLKDDEVQKTDTVIRVLGGGQMPIYIDNTQAWQTNYADLKYYTIPSYLINNKNIAAVGHPDLQPYEESYQHKVMFYNTNHSPSQIKNWNYGLYPSIIGCDDSFSNWGRDMLLRSQVSIVDNIYYKNTSSIAEWVVSVQDTPSLSRFIIASYYHDLDGNLCSNDSYEFYPTGTAGTTGANFTFYFRGYINLRNGNRSALQYTDLNGHTYQNTDDMYLFLEGIFWEQSYQFNTNKTEDMYLASDLDYGSSASLVHKKPGYLAGTQFDELRIFMTFWVKYTLPIVFPYCYNSTFSDDIISISLDYENQKRGATEFATSWNIQSWLDINLNCRTNGSKNIEMDPDICNTLDQSHSYINFTGQHSYSFGGSIGNYVWRDRNEWAMGQYEVESDMRPWSADLNMFHDYWRDPSAQTPWLKTTTSTHEKYTCPIVLSSEPALIFSRTVDSRNGNSYCYKVMQNYSTATVASTGGTISFNVYINRIPEQVTLTLNSDNDTTYTTLSNGGKVYWDGKTHGQATDGCIVYEEPGATWGSWEGFGPNVNLAPPRVSVSYFSQPYAGGLWYKAGWKVYGGTIYGKLTTVYTQDGYTFTDTDSSPHASSSEFVDSWQIRDLERVEHPVEVLYSKLEWGYSSDNLEYVAEHGSMPQIIVYVDKFSGYSGTLTSATATLDGQTYTSSVVENGKIKFTLPNDGYFTVTSITTSDNYVLLESSTISVTYGTQTCYIRTTLYSWSSVGNIVSRSTGGSSTDTVYYEIQSTPPGFIVSWSGYYSDNVGTIHNISSSVPSSANEITILSPTAEDDDVDYIYITLTNYQGETQVRTYGTVPTTPIFKQQTVGGGARLQAGWYPGGRGGIFYGRMSITASIDGVENTRTDSSVQTFSDWHYFSYPIITPTSERVVEIISSRLEWGLSADNLDRVSEWHE